MDFPDKLLRAKRRRSLVPFVGAGLSRRADANHFPSWSGLIARLVATAAKQGFVTTSERQELERLIDDSLLSYAAEIIRRKMPRDEFESLIEEMFHIDSTALSLCSQRRIFELQPRIVLTTNYDRLLEDTFAKVYGKAPSIATHLEATKVNNRLRRTLTHSTPLIFKIHGDVDEIDTIIIGERDYKKLLHQNNVFEAVLQTLFVTGTILFLGYSLKDLEIVFHLERLRTLLNHSSDPNYILVPEGTMYGLEKLRWRDELGVEPIEYQTRNGHEGLDDFLKELVASV